MPLDLMDATNGEVRMKQIAASQTNDGRNALFGLDANGVVYQYIYHANGLEPEFRWEALRMSTVFGSEPQ